MTVISLAHTNILRSHTFTVKNTRRISRWRKLLIIGLVFFIVVGVFLYVLESNARTAAGYKIRTLKNQLGELNRINKDLQISISNLKSINSLEARTGELKMVQAQLRGVEYLAFPSPNGVAAR